MARFRRRVSALLAPPLLAFCCSTFIPRLGEQDGGDRVLNGMPGYGVRPMQHPSIAALRQATYGATASSSQQQQRSGSPPVGILSVGSPSGGLIRQPSVSPPHHVVDASVVGSAAACMPYGHQVFPSVSVPHHHNGAAMYAAVYPGGTGGGTFAGKEHVPLGTFVSGPPPAPAEAFLNTSGGRFDHRLVYANGPPQTAVDRPPSVKQQQAMADGIEPNTGASKEITSKSSNGSSVGKTVGFFFLENGRGTPSSSDRQRVKGRSKESHPPTPVPPSPGGGSSVHDDVESSLSSPSWPRTPMSPAVHRVQQGAVQAHVTMGPPPPNVVGGSVASGSSCSNKECGASLVARLLGDPTVLHYSSDEWADRRAFYERLVHFCETYGHPITSQPTVSKQTVDLYKLYTAVKAKGGFEEVTKKKLWRDLCLLFNIGVSNSASGQLKKQYSRFLFPFECVFDLGGVDPQPILASLDSKKKSKSKAAAVNAASQQQQQQQPPQQYADTFMAGGQQEAAYHKSPYEHQTPAPYVNQPGTFSGHQPPPPPPPPPGQYQPRMTAPPTNAGPSTGPPPNEMIARDPFDDRMQAAPPTYYGCPPGQPPPHISFAAPMKPPYAGYPMAQGQQMLQMGPVAERLLYPPPRAFTPRDPTAGGYHPVPPPPAPPGPSGMTPHAGQQPPQPHPAHVVPAQPPLGMKPYGAMQQEQFINADGGLARTAPDGGTMPMVQVTAGFPQPTPSSSSQVGYPVYSQSSAQQQQQEQQAAPQGPQPPPPLSQPPPPTAGQFLHVTPHGHMDASGQQPSSSVVYSRSCLITWKLSCCVNAFLFFLPLAKLQMNAAVSSPPLHMGVQQQWQPQGGPSRPVVVHAPPPPVHGVYAPTAREPPPRFAKYPMPTQSLPFQSGLKDHASKKFFKSVPLQARREKVVSMFPPNSVEAAQVPVKRRKKISAKEIGPIDPWRIVMVFKSGLLFEITWALNVLNVLLYDDTSALYFGLNMMPGFLDALIDVWKQSLLELAHCLHLSLPAHFATVAHRLHHRHRLHNRRHHQAGETRQCERNGDLVDGHGNNTDPSLNRTGSRLAMDDRSQDGCWTRRPLWERRRRPVEDTDLPFSAYLSKKGCSRDTSRSSSTVSSCASNSRGESDNEEDDQKPRTVRFRSDLDVQFSLPSSCSFEISTDHDRSILERCLSASNALCGLSCIPGNEAKMSQSSKLLGAVATVVSLGLMPDAFKPDAFRTSNDDQHKTMTKGRPVQYNWYFEGLKTLVDDSFVVLCNLSPQLDLDSHDGSSVRQLLDALLSWATCKDSMALDPLTYAALVAPNRYAQEVLCKLSVMETNVDLILATPPWSRVETLLYLLAGQLSMMEEVMMREFAVALMHAFCLASPIACVAAALQTQTIQHLVAFLDQADSNMHQVVQLHGMQALRENPELMGTSVGMLRRAASTLLCMARIPACRHRFARHHIRLLNFTMSSLMDSRVATTVADVLYELQRVGCDADRENRFGALCC
ncbi:ARID/BRIGHT DNA binding domain protein [Trichuris suis]|nr:ARID/BRIGHT DNA binding domain protein [Trichuris suis]